MKRVYTFPMVFALKLFRFMLCSCSQIRWACSIYSHKSSHHDHVV